VIIFRVNDQGCGDFNLRAAWKGRPRCLSFTSPVLKIATVIIGYPSIGESLFFVFITSIVGLSTSKFINEDLFIGYI